MVRLINKKNILGVSNVVFTLMKIQECFTHIANWEHPDEIESCIYVMWHANQFLVHGLPDREKINILISNSLDGQIVANVCEKWGFKVRRGSAGKKGAVESTLKMLNALKNGEKAAIMVDGPRGPFHEVKRGAIALAKESGVPIVPVFWYSEEKTFKVLPSWDKMTCPIGTCKILNIYGKPIYIDKSTTDEQAKEIVKTALLELENSSHEKFKEAKRLKLWKK